MTCRFLPIVLLLQAVISVHTELVAVPVAVTDSRGHHVSGLNQEDFRVYEDGRLQPIAVFHHGDAPVTVGLIVDRSQSMRSKTPALLAAVSALLQSSRPDDELFAVGFNDRVSFAFPGGGPFTHDAKGLEISLAAVHAEGQTALYDGVAEGLQRLQLGHSQRRALIVLSDGGDNISRHTYDQVLELARRSDAVIYAIGLMGTSVAQEEEDSRPLERLCKDTGGVACFPQSAAQVATMSAFIARDIRGQYTLGFAPAAKADVRAFRKIEVRVTARGRGRLSVRARSGYVVPAAGEEKKRP